MQKIKQLFNTFLDFIYKKKCYFCSSTKECVKMCSKCYNELNFSDLRPNRILNGVNIYSAGIYEKNIQKMIRGLKYHNQKELAYYMAKFMWEYYKQIMEKNNITKEYQIVPVPLHKKREKKRGYNHMQLVAEELSTISKYEINNEILERIKPTKPQYKLSYAEKLKNMENAFKINPEKYHQKPILIIDDICTSGATLLSVIKEFKSQNIDDITCLCASSPR